MGLSEGPAVIRGPFYLKENPQANLGIFFLLALCFVEAATIGWTCVLFLLRVIEGRAKPYDPSQYAYGRFLIVYDSE